MRRLARLALLALALSLPVLQGCKRGASPTAGSASGAAKLSPQKLRRPDKSGGTAAGSVASGSAAASSARAKRWREDIEHLVASLAKKHKNAFAKLPRARFAAAAAKLAARVGAMSDPQVVLAVAALVAKLGDSHTRVGVVRMPRLPLALYWFDDGVIIAATSQQHRALLGAKLLAIGSKPIERLLVAAATHVAVDNAAGRKLEAPRHVVLQPLLRTLGAMGAKAATLEVALAGGAKRTVEVAPISHAGAVRWARVNMPRVPLRHQKQQFIYWNTYLPAANAVYFRYRRCAQMPQNPMPRFARGMLGFLDLRRVARVIIDLRGNPGGNSRVLRPLIAGLAARRQRLKVRVIVDRTVFSSALLNAIALKQLAGAKIVGEPTSGKPNHFGEIKMLRLPHSKLPVQYSTKYFRRVKGDPPTLVPDVRVPVRSGPMLAGKDPALAAALRE